MDKAVEDLDQAQAKAELARLAQMLAAANAAYHTLDAPELTDADYDALKRRNAAIEVRFPELKRADSPSDQVGGAVASGFGKVVCGISVDSGVGVVCESEFFKHNCLCRHKPCRCLYSFPQLHW
jgi:NAD-dependent DNA ligase